MEVFVSKPVEDKKGWTAPTLEKISIEELTSHLNFLHPMNDDGSDHS